MMMFDVPVPPQHQAVGGILTWGQSPDATANPDRASFLKLQSVGDEELQRTHDFPVFE